MHYGMNRSTKVVAMEPIALPTSNQPTDIERRAQRFALSLHGKV